MKKIYTTTIYYFDNEEFLNKLGLPTNTLINDIHISGGIEITLVEKVKEK